MAQFNEIKWEYSDDSNVPEDSIRVTPGIKDIIIDNASLNPADSKYSISAHNVREPKEKMTLNYWIDTADPQTNDIIENGPSRSILHTLGIALSGHDIGLPAPSSIIGGVVKVEVKLSKPNANGAQYPRVYKFEKSDDETIILYSQINQVVDMDLEV